jgi:apolipoprotein N-acyltransferase
MRNHRTFWFITLLSALLFNAAWLGFYTAWLVIPSFILIFYLFNLGFLYGFVWGLLVFTFHFHWLAQALVKHGGCSLLCTGLLMLPVILYFSALTGLWFCTMQWVKRWSHWLTIPITAFFWYMVDCYGLVPLGMGMGYPFINPCLPLVQYRWFLVVLSSVFPPAIVQHNTAPLVDRLCFVQPVANRAWCYGEPWTRSPHVVVSRIQAKQGAVLPHDILVSPESMLLFPLNQYSELVEALCSAKNSDNTYILGGVCKQDNVLEQVAYCLHKGLIIKTYVKKKLVPFAEQTPPAWQWLKGLRQRLLPGFAECIGSASNTASDECFHLAGCCVRPALCLEFFEQPAYALCSPETDAIMALINDSWYTGLFRQWLFSLAVLKSHTCGRLVVYIGHYGCYTIEPKNHSITQVRSCYASIHA